MEDMKDKLALLKEQIEMKIRHPYLHKYIAFPWIDEDRLLLLLTMLEQTELPKSVTQNYALTTMLIQIALDTHEIVSNNELEGDANKNRQLTVLAGVYYSGLYYKLLAEMEEIDMIASLAQGIKEVNEHKIAVYQKTSGSVEALMYSVKKIEASLFEAVLTTVENPSLSEFASHFLFIKRMSREREAFLQGESSVVFSALKKIAFQNNRQQDGELSHDQKKHLLHICNRYIAASREMLEQFSKQIPNASLMKRTEQLIETHQPVANTSVEEG